METEVKVQTRIYESNRIEKSFAKNQDFWLSTKCQGKLSLLFTRKCINCWSQEKINLHYSKHSTAEVHIFKQGYLWAAAKRSIAAAGHRRRSKFQTDMQGSTIPVQHCLEHSYYWSPTSGPKASWVLMPTEKPIEETFRWILDFKMKCN